MDSEIIVGMIDVQTPLPKVAGRSLYANPHGHLSLCRVIRGFVHAWEEDRTLLFLLEPLPPIRHHEKRCPHAPSLSFHCIWEVDMKTSLLHIRHPGLQGWDSRGQVVPYTARMERQIQVGLSLDSYRTSSLSPRPLSSSQLPASFYSSRRTGAPHCLFGFL